MAHRVTLIPGDGIGPEVTEAARRVLEASGAELHWERHEVGMPALERYGDALPAPVLSSIERNGVALKGPVSTPLGATFRSPNVGLRRRLDLFAQARPCRTWPGVPSRYSGIDLVVMRETTEDLYAGVEFEAGTDSARELRSWLSGRGVELRERTGISIKPISEEAALRAFRFAFDYARRHGRRRITVAHKASVMRFTDGLFLSAARQVAAETPDVELDDVLVDNLAAQLVRRPEDLDVVVAPNLYGDILADLAAGLVGSVGLVPGANHGERAAVFEPAHGTAPAHAGRDEVNPMATVLSGALMLRHLGEDDAARRVEAAVGEVLAEGRRVTYDVKEGGRAGAAATSEVADAIIEKLG